MAMPADILVKPGKSQKEKLVETQDRLPVPQAPLLAIHVSEKLLILLRQGITPE
jgi:hypothetical protein